MSVILCVGSIPILAFLCQATFASKTQTAVNNIS